MNAPKALVLVTLALVLAPAALAHDPSVYEPGVKVVPTAENPYLHTPHWSGHVSLAYVTPSGDGDVFGSTVEVDSAWGGSLGWEWRCGHWVGIDLNAMYAPHDVTVKGHGKLGETQFLPITLGLNIRLVPEKSPVDLYLGPLFGYALYDDIATSVEGSTLSTDVDADFIYGLNLGLQVPATRHGWAFYGAVKYLVAEYDTKLQIDGFDAGSATIDIDPWVFEAGIAYRY
jgi:outer membrane protein W